MSTKKTGSTKSNTYDVLFNDDVDGNSKGFRATLEYCKNWIVNNNGSNQSYFKDYKGGTVSIVCNETEKTVFETEVV